MFYIGLVSLAVLFWGDVSISGAVEFESFVWLLSDVALTDVLFFESVSFLETGVELLFFLDETFDLLLVTLACKG